MMGETERERFNVAYVSTLVVLLAQFGGVVWFASRMDSRMEALEVRYKELDVQVSAEVQKTSPLVFEFKYIREALDESKRDLKEIREIITKKQR
jgi:5-bromo-4-chloroindolyl phosphate hydrolysis protein